TRGPGRVPRARPRRHLVAGACRARSALAGSVARRVPAGRAQGGHRAAAPVPAPGAAPRAPHAAVRRKLQPARVRMSEMPEVEVFTDGACLGNPGPGGWAALLRFGALEKELSGQSVHTTNNRMELMAAIAGLEALTRPCRVTITTDSQYVQRGVEEWLDRWKANGWRTGAREPVKNRDLWERLSDALERHEVRWQ